MKTLVVTFDMTLYNELIQTLPWKLFDKLEFVALKMIEPEWCKKS